jgi:hypothetical protein
MSRLPQIVCTFPSGKSSWTHIQLLWDLDRKQYQCVMCLLFLLVLFIPNRGFITLPILLLLELNTFQDDATL